MDEECIDLFNKIYEEIDVLVEGTDPAVQRIPNISVNVRLKRIKKDLMSIYHQKYIEKINYEK